MLTFASPVGMARGTLSDLLSQAYDGYERIDPEQCSQWREAWGEFDEFAERDLSWSAGWLFLTRIGERTIGFASWDPSKRPRAVIGHNCIVPAHRHRGYGLAQMREVIGRLAAQGFAEATVRTGQDDFFLPARKMYERAGFRETGRQVVDGHAVVDYRLAIESAG